MRRSRFYIKNNKNSQWHHKTHKYHNHHEADGSLTLEAAIVLPIVVFTLFSIIYFAKILFIGEWISHELYLAGQDFSINTHLLSKIEILPYLEQANDQSKEAIATSLSIQDNLEEVQELLIDVQGAQWGEQPLENVIATMNSMDFIWQDAQILLDNGTGVAANELSQIIGQKYFKALFLSDDKRTQLKKWHVLESLSLKDSDFFQSDGWSTILVRYTIPLPIKLMGEQGITCIQGIRIRSFSGNQQVSTSVEQEQVMNNKVYVTEKGAKYHTNKTCFHIYVEAMPHPYADISQNHRPCELCCQKDETFNEEQIVYATKTSEVFHSKKECTAICKKIIELQIESAEKAGYTLCKTCQSVK